MRRYLALGLLSLFAFNLSLPYLLAQEPAPAAAVAPAE
ncbi:MAG: hypothetical protein JWN70_4773, partial [Planctomycetaceae bacterium]|nr:hypothetical protein [Planctomycetaceae bacterium]